MTQPVATTLGTEHTQNKQTIEIGSHSRGFHLYNTLFGAAGLILALCIVITWFPQNIWHLPIESSDSAAHYYFIHKLGSEGWKSVTSLWPNGDFYPPLFHIFAYTLQQLCAVFGLSLSVFASFNIVWILTSGFIFPLGMLMWCNYFMRNLRSAALHRNPLTWFYRLLLLTIPVLSVSSASHPFGMLTNGPLIAFGLGTSLLPLGLYFTLRLFDALSARTPSFINTGARLIELLAVGCLLLLSHPRIAFSFALLIATFMVFRLPRKIAIIGVGTILAGASAYIALVLLTETSSRLGDPASWFHSHRPSKTLWQAIWTILSDAMDTPASICFALLFVVCAISALMLSASGKDKANNIALLMNVTFLSMVYVATVVATGAWANLISAPWYRDENRIIAMLPLVTVPVIAAGFDAMTAAIAAHDHQAPDAYKHEGNVVPDHHPTRNLNSQDVRVRLVPHSVALVVVSAILLVTVCGGAQINAASRNSLSSRIDESANLNKADLTEQLTNEKYQVLQDVVRQTGTESAIVSDPMNGSMYAGTMFGANVLYPIMNAKSTRNGAIFTEAQQSFASGDPEKLIRTFCSITPQHHAYFLTLGPQAQSLQSFPFRAQYDVFHDRQLISHYLDTGALQLTKNYGDITGDNQDSILYKVNCS